VSLPLLEFPMPLVYRPAGPEDLERAEALVVGSTNNLTERHGFGTMATARLPNFQLFSLKDDPTGLWVADDSGEILGFAWSWVCDDLWFLAQLFVAPGHQGRGIGNELIQKTLDQARHSGATNRALITFTFNRVSQGLYIRHGMFPKMPIYFFGIPREQLNGSLADRPLRGVALEDTVPHRSSLARIDAQALGVSREKHHRYLSEDEATKGFLLYANSDCVGYVYVGSDGHIGPLAVSRSDALGSAFTTALKIAVDGDSPQVSAFLPGTCDAALSLAIEHGMRISFPMVLMATPNFGDLTQYLPRNPGFM
jgi:ribosomal protein S18 acetylase RimI-like enzyme